MKTLNTLIILISFGTTVFAQSTYTLSNEDSKMVVKGTSSVHDWESQVETMTGTATLNVTDGTIEGFRDLTVSVESESIKSGKRIMDRKTRGALNADDYPMIVFSFSEVDEITADSVTVSGTLSLAGATNDVVLKGTWEMGTDGSFKVSGVQPIDMEMYGIDPPTAMLGTLKTGKDVQIEYNVKFNKN